MLLSDRQYAAGIFKAGLLVSILCTSLFIARSSWITEPYISSAITFDLLITLPLAYLFFIRRSNIPKSTVSLVFFFSLTVAFFILPANNRSLLDLAIIYAVPLAELAALIYTVRLIFKARKTFISLRRDGYDVMERLRKVLVQEFTFTLPARAMAFEIGVFYIAFLKWKRHAGNNFFTYHKKSGVVTVISVLIFLTVAETIVVHILIAQWSIIAAWVLTALSAYFVFQLFAHAKAAALRPIEIAGDRIFLRCGLIGDAEIPAHLISDVEKITATEESVPGVLKLTPLGGFTPPNIRLTLTENVYLSGFYGFQKRASTFLLSIDEPEIFIRSLQNAGFTKLEIDQYA